MISFQFSLKDTFHYTLTALDSDHVVKNTA